MRLSTGASAAMVFAGDTGAISAFYGSVALMSHASSPFQAVSVCVLWRLYQESSRSALTVTGLKLTAFLR
jgi:hypothetical protein